MCHPHNIIYSPDPCTWKASVNCISRCKPSTAPIILGKNLTILSNSDGLGYRIMWCTFPIKESITTSIHLRNVSLETPNSCAIAGWYNGNLSISSFSLFSSSCFYRSRSSTMPKSNISCQVTRFSGLLVGLTKYTL